MKIFESRVGDGFDFYYPYLFTGILTVTGFANLLIFQYHNVFFNNIWVLVLAQFLVDLFIIQYLQKRLVVKIYKLDDHLELEIVQGKVSHNFNGYSFVKGWWCYNQFIYDEYHDEDEVLNSKKNNDKLAGTGRSMPRSLFIELESQNNDKLYLVENLEEYEDLPLGWNYQIIDKVIFDQSIESCQLKELKPLLV